MLQPLAGMRRAVSLCTAAWQGGRCVLVTLLKPHLKKRKAKSKNVSERLCKIYYELVVGVSFKGMWLVYTVDNICGVENIGYRVIREIQWELANKKWRFYTKWRATETLLPA